MTAFGCNGLKQVFVWTPLYWKIHQQMLNFDICSCWIDRVGWEISSESVCQCVCRRLWVAQVFVQPRYDYAEKKNKLVKPALQCDKQRPGISCLQASGRFTGNAVIFCLEPRQSGGFAAPCPLTVSRCAWVNSASPLVVAARVRNLKQEVVAGWLADTAKLPGFSCGRASRESTQVGHSDRSVASGKTRVAAWHI